MDLETCKVCGAAIPKGGLVCPKCDSKTGY